MLKEGVTKIKGAGKEKRKYKEKPWLYNPCVVKDFQSALADAFSRSYYSLYSTAKVWAGQFDEDAKVALERVIEASEKSPSGLLSTSQNTTCLVKAKIGLAQLLQEMGKPKDDYKE